MLQLPQAIERFLGVEGVVAPGHLLTHLRLFTSPNSSTCSSQLTSPIIIVHSFYNTPH